MLSIKFGRNLYPAPWPKHILWFWSVAFAVAASSLAIWQFKIMARGDTPADPSKQGEGSSEGAKGLSEVVQGQAVQQNLKED
jgi:hypothetical protein